MLTSLALIFLVGLSLAAIFGRLNLPRLVGMLLAGILLGPFVLDLLDPQILGISAELRRMALVIILIKAGLSLNFSDLKKVGRPAFCLQHPLCFSAVPSHVSGINSDSAPGNRQFRAAAHFLKKFRK